MSLRSECTKIILFGLLGAAGCLVGGLAGEILYPALSKSAGNSVTSSLVERPQIPHQFAPLPAPPDPPPVPSPNEPPPSPRAEFPREFKERLERERAEEGGLELALAWQDFNDVDLICIEPDGTCISAGSSPERDRNSRQSRSGGTLDIDMNGGSGGPTGWRRSDKPVEHIRWPLGRVPLGHYRVVVNGFDKHDGPNRTRFEIGLSWSEEIVVKLSEGGQLPVVGIISFPPKAEVMKLLRLFDTDPKAFFVPRDSLFFLDFEVRPGVPSLRLSVPEEVRLNQGGKSLFSARIARTNFRVPVTLRLAGDLEDIDSQGDTMAGDKTEGEIHLKADDAARGGERRIKVIATGFGLQAEADMKLVVVPLPTGLRVATPAELPINQGTANTMTIRIARDHFRGPVDLRFKGDVTGLSFKDTTIAANQSETEMEVQSDAGLPPGKRQIRMAASGGGTSSETLFQVDVRPQLIRGGPSWSWQALIRTSVWTALLAIGLSLALVMGQKRHLGRSLLSVRALAVVGAGGTLAGLLAGGVGQLIYYGLMQLALLPQPGLVVGWLLLGGLLARGVGTYIPNLPPYRAVVAGLVGGVLAALAFLVISDYNDHVGRLVGAAILGFCIGLMVAVAEAVSRVAWLEVIYGGRETRRVTLGREPVLLGGSPACTVFVAGAPAVGLRYTFGDGKIYCQTGESPPVVVAPDDKRTLGSVLVIARAQGAQQIVGAPANKNGSKLARSLRLRSGKVLSLPINARLRTDDLPGLPPAAGNEFVAEVVPHPNDPALLGLKNLSAQVWSARLSDGSTRQIDQGRSVKLAQGTRIDFGTTQGELI